MRRDLRTVRFFLYVKISVRVKNPNSEISYGEISLLRSFPTAKFPDSKISRGICIAAVLGGEIFNPVSVHSFYNFYMAS